MPKLSSRARRIGAEYIRPAPEIDVEGALPVRTGVTPAGKFATPEGEFYVKAPRTPGHAHSEMLASMLYRMTGLDAPKFSLGRIDDPDVIGRLYRHDRQRRNLPKEVIALHSPWVEGLGKIKWEGGRAGVLSRQPDMFEGVAMDAMLGTTDLRDENILRHPRGHVFRVDLGGNLFFSPGGLRMDRRQPAAIYHIDDPRFQWLPHPLNYATDEDFVQSANRRLLRLTPDDISAAIAASVREWNRVAPDVPLRSDVESSWAQTFASRHKALSELATDIASGRARGWREPDPYYIPPPFVWTEERSG